MRALACELPAERGLPLARLSGADLAREALARGICCQISGATAWRWLAADAIRPGRYRSWIFPRDPAFRDKAAQVLDLDAGRVAGRRLHPADFVVGADETPSVQARRRRQRSAPPAPGRDQLVEHEHARRAALCYRAAWDVRRARAFGRTEPRAGIAPFERSVAQAMDQSPTARPAARSGCWTAAPPTAVSAPSRGCGRAGRRARSWCWSTCRSRPAG